MLKVHNSTLTKVLDDVYSRLSHSESINRESEKNLLDNNFKEIWKIETEIEVESFQKEITLFIGFENSFPLTLPRIYLSKESFDEIGFIPHIDKKHFICTFHTDCLILDETNPFGIVKECLLQAKKIIKDGLEKNNYSDFKDELKAYWTDNDESDINHYLSLLSNFPKDTTILKICKLIPAYNHINYLVYQSKKDIGVTSFLDFVSSKGCKTSEADALFLCDYELKPPFPKTNIEVLTLISSSSLTTFKKYINSKTPEKHIFFTSETSSKDVLLGWRHKPLIIRRKGFRKDSLTAFNVLSQYQKNNKIEKILVNEYNNNRIETRTSGFINKKYTFLVAGLGSIGSNLIYFLNGVNYPTFKLVDNDILKIENIGRHLLGINSINSFKTAAVKAYLNNIRPDQNISIKNTKIESVVMNNVEYINDCSYAFITIGLQNIENFLIRMQNEGLITVPLFILWVEPYAVGGHCLFIHPEDKTILDNLYEKQLYRFNIISPKEYINNNPILSKQEAGCQTSYTPYSGNDIILFLSSLYGYINDIIKNNTNRSLFIQWTGNIDFAKEIGLEINKPYISNEAYNSNKFYLNDVNQKR